MPTELASRSTFLVQAPAEDPATNVAVPVRRQQASALRRPAMAFFLFLVVALVAYLPALDGRFFWDDTFLAQSNPLNRSPWFILEAFRHTLFGDTSAFYRPTQTLTYIFDYWCWGLEPFGYHVTNVLIHACNGFALFLLLRRMLPVLVPSRVAAATTPRSTTTRGAQGIALLWTLHPVHSAAVAYISGRADSLAMLFCLAAWLACERALESNRPAPRAGWAVGAFVSLLLGLCSKEIAFVWLVLFGCWLFLLRPSPHASPRAAFRAKCAVFGVGLVALACYVGLRQLPPPHPAPPPYPPMPARLVLMLRALGDYSRLMVFPDRLFMERQVFAAPGLENPADPLYYDALAVIGALTLAAFALGAYLPSRGQALRRAGAVWFLCGFLPVSNLFLLNASVAEHWLYLPSIGFLLFLAGVALDVPWSRLGVAFTRPQTAVVAVVVAAAALGGRTWLRAHDWVDGLTFYGQTIRDGGDTPRMREGLALTYYDRGNLTAAAELLEGMVARYPHLYSTRANLATVQRRAGQTDEARAAFEQIAADLIAAHDGRGGAREFATTVGNLDLLETPGDPAWAKLRHDLLQRAAQRFPDAWDLISVAITDRQEANDPATVLALTSQYAKAHWWHLPSHLAMGQLLAAAGRPDEALAVWKQALTLDIRDATVPAAAAVFCLEHNRLDEALTWQQIAVYRQPDSLRQRLLLAQVLERQGKTAEAEHERGLVAKLVNSSRG